MRPDANPTARALLTLELIQASPGITAGRLADKLGHSERAARRHVAILREAGIPIESVRGPYGGYRVGRGLRLPPLMFTAAEALGLVMAALDGHHDAGDPTDRAAARPDPATTSALVQACSNQRRVRLRYRSEAGSEWAAEVDPWAVVVRHGRWYLLCHSHAADARRAYRIDRVCQVDVLDDTFTPPADLDPVALLEEHLAVGWEYDVEVIIDAPLENVAPCTPRSLGRLERLDAATTRLVGSTNPVWYAEQLAAIPAAYRIVRCPELRDATRVIGQRLLAASESDQP